MKIAVTGKGGVGKTTIASLIARYMADRGNKVIAVDADPDANLASALGFTDIEKIVPISGMEALIEERTGAKPGTSGSLFKLNPRVDDLPEKLWIEQGNIRLMVMGTVKKGGGGCVCPESALLKNLISHLVLYRNEIIILDMEAGIEHLGRGTASAVDVLIVVVEPGRRSLETAEAIKKLAGDIGLKRIAAIGNKIRKDSDREFIVKGLRDISIAGFLPFDNALIESDMSGIAPASRYSGKIEEILKNIKIEKEL